MLKHVKCSSLYTGKISYGIVTSETKCYFTVTFKKTYSNGNDKIVKLFKRDGAMTNWDIEFVYYVIIPEVVEVVEVNKHILLVMKWLKNPESVSQEELEANYKSASTARSAYWAASSATAATASTYWAAYAADWAGASGWAAWAAAWAAAWVDEYFKSTGEDKQIYLDKLGE
jgi:hypothetical protein